jgi:hypothetical protein
MMSKILSLKEGESGIKELAIYSLPPKKAMVCFIEQFINKNWNTWEYPEEIEGMRESTTVGNHWYYDVPKMDGNGISFDTAFAAYPADTFVLGVV